MRLSVNHTLRAKNFNMTLPDNFLELSRELDAEFNFKKILIVNTPNTGLFLDNLFLDERTTRVKYTHDAYNKLIETVTKVNTKFDLICLDPYHYYKESYSDYNLMTSFLSDTGILLSHDCYPPDYNHVPQKDKKGRMSVCWCGETYAAFVEFAYANPDYLYAVIKNDYGLGIITKREMQYVKKIVNNENQKQFLDLFKHNKNEEAYNYFEKNAKDIINLID